MPSAPISSRASSGPSQRRSSSPNPSARASSTAANARTRCASLRTRSTDPPLAKWQSMPSLAAAAPTTSTVSCIARRIARMASRPCRRANAASDVANSAEHQPPLRPGRPEAGHLAFDDGDAQGRVGQCERVRGPQAGEPGADDADIDLQVLGEGGARRQRGRKRPPTTGRAVGTPRRAPALHPAPRLGEDLAQRRCHEVDLLLPADQWRGQLDDGIPAVVGPADQPGLEERA